MALSMSRRAMGVTAAALLIVYGAILLLFNGCLFSGNMPLRMKPPTSSNAATTKSFRRRTSRLSFLINNAPQQKPMTVWAIAIYDWILGWSVVPELASAIYAVSLMLVCGLVALPLYRRRIYIKI